MVLNVVAIVTPAPGKEERVKEILVQLAKDVEKHESDVARYVPHKIIGAEGATEFVVVERYDCMHLGMSASPCMATCEGYLLTVEDTDTRTRQP